MINKITPLLNVLIIGCQDHSTDLHVYGSADNDLIKILEKNPFVHITHHESSMVTVTEASLIGILLLMLCTRDQRKEPERNRRVLESGILALITNILH